MRALEVGVIGCGTAGPAAALFLARAGHSVTVYERFEQPAAVGAGIILQPTGQHVLRRLGLLDGVTLRGARLDGLRVTRHEAGPLLELSYRDVSPDYFGVGLHRGVLFHALFSALREQRGVELVLGTTCVGVTRAPGGRFHVVDDVGETHGPHDFVIVADGARSRVRDAGGLARSVAPYPWGALWFVARDPDRVFSGELYQVVRGTRRMLGLLPTGVGPGDPAPATPLVSLFWSMPAAGVAAWRERGFAGWCDEIRAMAPHAGFVVDQIDSPDEVLFSSYLDVVMSPWNARGVVHLGDSAHAMSPQLGQGANLALLDAMVLADVLEAEAGDFVRALDRYSRERQRHLAYYELVTRWLTPFFQSDHDVLGSLRDLAMPWLARLGPVRRAMVLGMTGTADGNPFTEIPL